MSATTEQLAEAKETQGGSDARSFFGLVFWLGIGGMFLLPVLGAAIAFIGGLLWLVAPIPNAMAAEAVEEAEESGGGCWWLLVALAAIIIIGLLAGVGAVGMIEAVQ